MPIIKQVAPSTLRLVAADPSAAKAGQFVLILPAVTYVPLILIKGCRGAGGWITVTVILYTLAWPLLALTGIVGPIVWTAGRFTAAAARGAA